MKPLTIERLRYRWPNGSSALERCSFSIPGPGLWMLVGSNGSGKSTLLRLIAGLLKAESGEIISSVRPALVFQNPDHQLLLPSCGSELAFHLPEGTALSAAVIDQALEQVGLGGMADRPIHSLSGGQKQRLAIASALLAALSGTGYGIPERCADGFIGGGMAMATGGAAECCRGSDFSLAARVAVDGHRCTVASLFRCLPDWMFFGLGYAGIGFASRSLIWQCDAVRAWWRPCCSL